MVSTNFASPVVTNARPALTPHNASPVMPQSSECLLLHFVPVSRNITTPERAAKLACPAIILVPHAQMAQNVKIVKV